MVGFHGDESHGIPIRKSHEKHKIQESSSWMSQEVSKWLVSGL